MSSESMMARRGVIGLLAGATTLVLTGCGLLFPSDRLRQKITVEVETPAGLRSGSSVVETEVRKGKSWGDASGTTFKLEGEAVAVDLPGGRTLFALLRGGGDTQGDAAAYQTRLLYEALNAGAAASVPVEVEGMNVMQARAAAKSAEVSLILPEKLYPMLVTFADNSDPKSVERVAPALLAATFGPGVRLRRITVEVTDDDVTTGIEKRMGWLQSHQGSLDYTGRLHPDAPERDVTKMAFSHGTNLSTATFSSSSSE